MRFIGLDVGSVSVKLIVLDEDGNRLAGYYERHRGHPLTVAYDLLKGVVNNKSTGSSLSITGSAGRLIADALGTVFTNELVAQTYATRRLYPHIKTIFELGGEDSKLIILGEDGIEDFSMNSVCAAGTGSFLDQQAERLRLSIEEFSELALKSKKPPRIAGRCSVFAKSDMIHLQQIATPVEDIVAGLCFAVARNFKGSIVRGRSIKEPVSFHGGVAANKGMVRAFREVFNLEHLFVPEEFALMGAIGAALKDMDDGTINTFEIEKLKLFIESSRISEQGHKPLISDNDDFFERHLVHGSRPSPQKILRSFGDPGFTVHGSRSEPQTLNSGRVKAYLGIDIGSISTNLAVIDEEGNLLAKRYLMTAGRPIEAVRQGLNEIGEEIGDMVEIMGVGTTGSGRYMIADYVGADIVKNEITAQAAAAVYMDKDVDTIFEIGGQDSKYISLRDGIIVDFEMNKACAAGTGSFLEEQAEKLNISIKGEFAECACFAKNPCRLGERCTVFMENSLMASLQRGADRNNLLAGLAYSIVQNYINKVVAGKPIGENIFFQGGVAFNKSVVAAFERYLGKKITVPPNHDVTGAIGMALIAMRHMKDRESFARTSGVTSFKGFELSRRPYKVSSFQCHACPNVCEINRVKIEGEDGHLFYGGRCERYDVRRKRSKSELPDLFAFREEMLWKAHTERQKSEDRGQQKRDPNSVRSASQPRQTGTIGIPYIFLFHDYLPFWTVLLRELGFEVVVSPKTNREIVNIGTESVLADTCFPVKVAHGHIKYLVDKGINDIFIPSFINMNTAADEFERGYPCPLTQTIPYAAKVAHPGVRIIAPVVNHRFGTGSVIDKMVKSFKPFGIKGSDVLNALTAAEKAQGDFSCAIKERGDEVLSSIKERAVVIVGRAYNAFDSGVNLDIPGKLADLGVLAIPMDFLRTEEIGINDRWPNMYWRSGQRILRAARLIRESPHLYAIYIGNFSCGPDSFILKYFSEEMKGKPFLHLEIDEHSADAGAITRCEAFLDSIEQQYRSSEVYRGPRPAARVPLSVNGSRFTEYGSRTTRENSRASELPSFRAIEKRTIYIPRMADHAFALAAAFEKCGVPAEVLPESDKEAIDTARRYVSGKECYPCTVTTGDMLKKALSPDFRPEESAFFMPSGTGPCRFGQYNIFHRMVLDELGFNDVPIYSPNQDVGFYKDLGIVGKDFTAYSWKGIVAYEILSKCLHETRPYEKEKGSTEKVYQEYIKKLYLSLRGIDGNLEDILKNIRQDFEGLPKYEGRKPLIGIVGEIFVRSNRFSNEELIKKVESLGGEAWLAPVEEWIYYVNLMGIRKALIKKDLSAIIEFLLKKFFQKRIEHRFSRHFKGFLKTLKEPDTREILRKALPYLHDSFEGEAILSIGKSIDLIERGVSGIINAIPFGCMPGTVVTTLMHGISRDYGIPCISISYDGTESPATSIQLEAFMNQARQHSQRR